MAGSDKRKQSLYFNEQMLAEIQEEAIRLDRSMSWVVQRAWKGARERIRATPTNEPPGTIEAPASANSESSRGDA